MGGEVEVAVSPSARPSAASSCTADSVAWSPSRVVTWSAGNSPAIASTSRRVPGRRSRGAAAARCRAEHLDGPGVEPDSQRPGRHLEGADLPRPPELQRDPLFLAAVGGDRLEFIACLEGRAVVLQHRRQSDFVCIFDAIASRMSDRSMEAAFGLGYGEENDFCMRARQLGLAPYPSCRLLRLASRWR